MTVEGIPCPEPGCEGTIEDGYCDITGLAYRPPPGPGPGGGPAGSPAGRGTDGTLGSGVGGTGGREEAAPAGADRPGS